MSVEQDFEDLKPSLKMVNSRVGEFAVYRMDAVVSQSVALFGEYCHAEIQIMSQWLTKDDAYIDIGTNIGYHAVAMHKQVGCDVLAFEPHPKHFAVATFNCQNYPIQVLNAAVSDKTDPLRLTDFDPAVLGNYGDLHSTDDTEKKTIEVPSVVLDDLDVQRCSVVKIDAEGHEINVLRGAEKTIDKFRPVIFYEAIGIEDWPPCFDLLKDKDYKQYWVACRHKPVAPTFIETDENPFKNDTVCNILAVPIEKPQPDFLMPVNQGQSFKDLFDIVKKYVLIF
jgi:FkbM family methyltransferase